MEHHKTNKTEQLAQFLLEQGKYMSAFDVVEADFRFDGEREQPAVNKVQSMMSNFAKVSRYVYDRRHCDVRRKNGYQIKMLAITERGSQASKDNARTLCRNSNRLLWQQVLRSF
ncbi:hypothetical protein [Aeromonas salmonicida]|uniref:hypothetical protein n=1 Tax=Aeromonas salmonicida TaxID=645 RepID=UPI003D23FBF5